MAITVGTVTRRSFSAFLRQAILLITMLIALPAYADVFTYVKLGEVNVDLAEKSNPLNLALNLGYELDSYLADFSLVAEVNRTIDNGETNRGDDLKFESNGIYLVYKSTRSLYTTFRVGIVENNVIEGSSSRRSNGTSIGGGVGVVIGRAQLQIEYTSYAGDAKHFTFGLQFRL